MQTLLQGGLTEDGGTSRRLQEYIGAYLAGGRLDAGGKTGTTNNHSDAWFVGVTPGLVCGAWVGGEYRCIHFRSGALGQGARLALPPVGAFLQRTLGDARLAKTYLRRFMPPAALADESPFGNYLPDSASVDSLYADSTAVFADNPWDDGDEPYSPAEPAAPAQPAAPPSSDASDPATAHRPATPRQHSHEGEELFE